MPYMIVEGERSDRESWRVQKTVTPNDTSSIADNCQRYRRFHSRTDGVYPSCMTIENCNP
ncbi:MAG: hypothetical protein WBB29_02335 [Geitlerinemataceae cyanobacterium]